MSTSHHNPIITHRRGITLVETVLSLLILGGAFVAALNTIGSARGAQALVTQRQYGLTLAEDLMAEILSQDTYQEGLLFGPESGEALNGRIAFDAVDDFNGWESAPPTDPSGITINGASDYSRSIEIVYAQLDDISATSVTDQGLLRITVTVKYRDKEVANLVAYRTDVWQAPQEVY
jgi:type II secretory pathway pseudopilin PulG